MRLLERQRRTFRAARIGAVLIPLLAAAYALPAAALASQPPRLQPNAANSDLRRVLSVVERRTADEKIREKMRSKLGELNDRELRLVATLCERISRNGASARADIAFSIVTAMVVLR